MLRSSDRPPPMVRNHDSGGGNEREKGGKRETKTAPHDEMPCLQGRTRSRRGPPRIGRAYRDDEARVPPWQRAMPAGNQKPERSGAPPMAGRQGRDGAMRDARIDRDTENQPRTQRGAQMRGRGASEGKHHPRAGGDGRTLVAHNRGRSSALTQDSVVRSNAFSTSGQDGSIGLEPSAREAFLIQAI